MTDDEVWTAAVQWVKAITGNVTTIKAYQAGPTPALPYCMVNLTGTFQVRDQEADVEYTETDTENSEGELEIEAAPVIETEWRFSVHAYGPSPTGILRPLVSASKLPQKWEPYFPGTTIHELSQIRFVPDWINNSWQPRAQVDLIVRGFTRDGFVIDVAEQTSFTVERL